ncbi:MAG: IPT/TIG domain-containing protein [Bacteroidales bacterium]
MKKIINKLTVISLIIFSVILSVACEKEDEHPEIRTLSPATVSGTEALLRGSVIQKGSFEILDYGFVVKTNSSSSSGYIISLGNNPENGIYEYKYSSIGNFSNYYYMTYITNTEGTIYGDTKQIDFLPVSISGMNKYVVSVGDTVTIFGRNLGTSPGSLKVTIGSYESLVIEANDTYARFVVNSFYESSYSNRYTIYLRTRNDGNNYNCGSLNILPNFYEFFPKSGTTGNTLYIYGNFLGGRSYYVYFNSTKVYASVASSYGYVSASVPSGLSGAVNIKVEYEGGGPYIFSQQFIIN